MAVTIEQIRQLDARLVFLRVKTYYLPWRFFGRGRVRGLRRQQGHDIVGWICGMNGGNRPEDAYVMLLPTWTGRGFKGVYIYLRDIHDLQVLVNRPEDILPGICPGLADLGTYLIHPDRLDNLRRLDIEVHLQWCLLCQGSRSRVAAAHSQDMAKEP